MQLTLFDMDEKRDKRAGNPYRDKKGRFCNRTKSIEKELAYWKNKAEAFERAYMVVVKRLIKDERNA